MLSTDDVEMLIISKKREIEKEKALLGIEPVPRMSHPDDDKENEEPVKAKQVKFKENHTEILSNEKRVLSEQHQNESSRREDEKRELNDLEERIPPDLERYIRRYIGIPAMLKAGEYSPNNPLLRGEVTERGDALLGLGEYERRRNTLRKIRQAQYRHYLDQQAKKKQEAKEQAERERLEREEKERLREERERQLLLERERYTPERRRASVAAVPVSTARVTTKVDTGVQTVQVDALSAPLSVAVQTEDVELYRLSPSPVKCLTQAERELSPRTVDPNWTQKWDTCERRRSYGDFDERTGSIKKSNRDKLVSDLRHSYMPSIFDADAIHMRNLQAEKEAAARRQFYQQELKNQILEQQRIREERKTREKMLEQAEMRRLEEQLRMLRVAQEREVDKQHDITTAMKDNAKDYNLKRSELQREIDIEQQKLIRANATTRHATPRHASPSHVSPPHATPPNPTPRNNTSKSDPPRSKLPFYYEKSFQTTENDKPKKPYSFNIPDNSVFSANYDVDSYLRKNLNFNKIDLDIENIGNNNQNNQIINKNKNVIIEKALIHEPKEKPEKNFTKENDKFQTKQTENYEKFKNTYDDLDNISIPVLRHSPKIKPVTKENESNLSDAMKKVDDKWKVPAVQKNILKSLPNDDGKNVNILTQLGSIRRQLQLEQFKLDKMLSKDKS